MLALLASQELFLRSRQRMGPLHDMMMMCAAADRYNKLELVLYPSTHNPGHSLLG
jgi:hypothetical protein